LKYYYELVRDLYELTVCGLYGLAHELCELAYDLYELIGGPC
jgi:hypothetical protein